MSDGYEIPPVWNDYYDWSDCFNCGREFCVVDERNFCRTCADITPKGTQMKIEISSAPTPPLPTLEEIVDDAAYNSFLAFPGRSLHGDACILLVYYDHAVAIDPNSGIATRYGKVSNGDRIDGLGPYRVTGPAFNKVTFS